MDPSDYVNTVRGEFARIGVTDIPAAELKLLAAGLYNELEAAVGIELSANLSEQQLKDFEAVVEVDDGDDRRIMAFLLQIAPNYAEVVERRSALQLLRLRGALSAHYGTSTR